MEGKKILKKKGGSHTRVLCVLHRFGMPFVLVHDPSSGEPTHMGINFLYKANLHR